MRPRFQETKILLVATLAGCVCGCGSSGGEQTQPNPVPTISSIIPASTEAGGAAFSLTVDGTNFVSNSVVNFNGSAKTTTFVSSTQLSAAIAAADIAAIGSPTVSVTNPAPGGGTSNSLTFAVTSTQITFSFGAEETVFSSAADSCEALDVPDTPAHAVRLADGSLMLEDGDAPRNYAMFGTDFSSLKRSCTAPILVSDDLSAPDTFDNQEWIWSVYGVGNVIHALIHNEFHDPIAPNCKPGDSSPANPCWYNSISYAVSSDGGHTFTHATPPGQLLAPPPQQWNAQGPPAPPPPYGYFEPSNFVQAQDGFFYAVFKAIAMNQPQNGNVCVMRTQNLGDPTSWRAWDGSGFNLQMANPYTSAPTLCNSVSPGIAQPTLTYNAYLGKYMMIGSAVLGNPSVCGAVYALSSDLIHWTDLQIMRTAYFSHSPCLPPGGNGYLNIYFSIIDHSDTTANFEKPGRTPYLYYTREQWANGGGTLNRDLVRLPMVITTQ